MDVLFAMRDLGITDPLPKAIDARSRSALEREINRVAARRHRRRLLRRPVPRLVFIPAVLFATASVGAAATAIVTGLDPSMIANRNVRDAPLRLFEHNLDAIGVTPAPRETVIPSTVREIGTFTLAGYGQIHYWVANTRQHGICTSLRLSDGSWVGLQNGGRDGGNFPGCWATRAQIGGGALIVDGLDYIQSTLPARDGRPWYPRYIIYGAITTPQVPARVRDTVSGTDAALVSGHYFAIVLHRVGNDYGDHVHLEAFDASGRPIATEGKPLPGTPTG